MLYVTHLGVKFWSDELLHITWLYNQTYHSAVKMTPFEVYIGSVPSLDSLITFGIKITAKKPGDCPTTFHSWTYDGIFLGYQNTMYNIQYWDGYTSTTKTEAHDLKDGLQYGDLQTTNS